MIERRLIDNEGVEVRTQPNGKPLIEGYAAVFGSISQNLGGFVERTNRGMFAKTLQESDVRAYVNHDKNYILGRVSAGTLRVAEDSRGLHYEIDPADTSYARDLQISIERRDVTQSSFGFTVVGPNGESWSQAESGMPLRDLNEVRLFDVSPVVTPAYDSTVVDLGQRALTGLCELRGVDLVAVRNLDTERAVAALLAGSLDQLESRVLPVGDPDSDPMAVVSALDAVIDELLDAFTEGNADQAQALAMAADVTVDKLLALMALPDPDDTPQAQEEAPRSLPEPQLLSVAQARLKLMALKRRI